MKLFKKFGIMFVTLMVIGLVLAAGTIYVAAHFIQKFW